MDAARPSSGAQPKCTGSPHFNMVIPSSITEWPDNLPGLVCKTPPFGYYHNRRFAECCSGTVYNITAPTTPDHPAYPVSCQMVCQVSPELDKSNPRYPYGFSEHFMCLNNVTATEELRRRTIGEDGSETVEGLEEMDIARRQIGGPAGVFGNNPEVVCATITVKGVPMPTSYPSTPHGPWETMSYSRRPNPLTMTDKDDVTASVVSDWTWGCMFNTRCVNGKTPSTSATTTAVSSSSTSAGSAGAVTSAPTTTGGTGASGSGKAVLSLRALGVVFVAAMALALG